MSAAPDRSILQALAALERVLAKLDAPAMVIGGIAVIARGVPRSTVDVDATIWGSAVSLEELFAALETEAIVPRIPDAREFAQRRQVLLLEHRPTGTPLEITLGWLPFEREALARATVVDFGGSNLPIPLPEDLVVYKAVAWRDRDKEDVERLLLLHGAEIDLERVRQLVAQFAEALGEPERIDEFDVVVQRALGGSG